MPDVQEVFRQATRTVRPDPGALERQHRRRRRTGANRRIAAFAAVAAVALAMFATVGWLQAREDPTTPMTGPRVVSGALAYSLGGDIYVADPDGTNPFRITDVAAVDDECPGELRFQLPSWSPDGQFLAFRGPHGPGCSSPTGVVITDPQGNVVATFPGETQVNLMAPVWSPDSTRVAVWDEYGRTIGVYRIDGTRETQITMPSDWSRGDIGYLAWMPDGSSLLVDQNEVPLDGTPPRELPFPFTEFNSWPQQYSSDGSLVAYADRHGLMVARPDGSETRTVFGPVGPYTWMWSPSGELIALSANLASANPENPWPPNDLYVVDLESGSVTQVFEGERRAVLWVIGFSPDGDRVLFSDSHALWSVEVDGSDARHVAGAGDATWRPI